MKHFMLYIAVVLLSFGIALPVSAQAGTDITSGVSAEREASSLDQLDLAVAELARSIRPKLLELPPDSRIRVGGFYFDDSETDLGSYWTQQLSGALVAGGGALPIISPDADPQAAAAYVLRGSLLEAGETLRVYTRLVKTADETLINSWNTDLTVTDFIADLIQTSGSSSSNVRRDRYEPDSRENPLAVTIGGPEIARTIHDQNDNDWFSITPDRVGTLILETSGSMDTYMYLYESGSSSELRSNDDGGEGVNARIEWNVEAGKTYIARVKGLDSSDVGQYGFTAVIEAIPEDTNEPNDTREEATLITSDSRTETVFGSPQDIDWYKVTIGPDGGQLSVFTESRLDTIITIYQENEEIAEDDDSGSGGNARVNIIVNQGDYYIKVSELDGRSGRYTLCTSLRPAPIPDAYENDNSRSDAKDITIGDNAQERTFSDSNDIDWVRIVIAEAANYYIVIRSYDNELDSYMELYDADYDIIAEDDDSAGTYNPRIQERLEPGTYHLKITCLDDDPLEDNRYTLQITKIVN
ncbi:hypothetical protein FACS1894110_07230 [Spirochaetia bacterium]|nr:hypothetical protein FACS1894110_07230 [Spirochaetia bacterium]